MDIIYLHGLKVDCIIGIWEWERRTTQTLTIHLDMAMDVRRAAASDDIHDTLNYKAVAKSVTGFRTRLAIPAGRDAHRKNCRADR